MMAYNSPNKYKPLFFIILLSNQKYI